MHERASVQRGERRLERAGQPRGPREAEDQADAAPVRPQGRHPRGAEQGRAGGRVAGHVRPAGSSRDLDGRRQGERAENEQRGRWAWPHRSIVAKLSLESSDFVRKPRTGAPASRRR